MSSARLSHFIKQLAKEVLRGNFDIANAVKYFPAWKASLEAGRNSIKDEQPWITFFVIDLFKKVINSDTKVFEYGGGGSTLFFVNRAKEVVTVEHDPDWFRVLQKIVADKKITNWSGNFISPDKKLQQSKLSPSAPKDYFSSDVSFSNNTFKTYASFIDSYTDNYFDIVLVDGRARPSCAWHSVPKLKKGGLLIIDNSDRDYYFFAIADTLKKEFELVYNNRGLSPYVDFFTQTGVWRKL